MNAILPTTLEALRQGRLTNCRALRLGGGLTEFPREIFDLADTLEQLDLSGNALTTLPDDLGRLRKLRVLFCSGNRFERLPPSLGDCPALSQIGFRAAGLRDIPAEALPPSLRWLTLTDNQIEALPPEIGERPALQKLMLAGNRLRHLPNRLADAPNLELLRLSANQFDTLPPWLVGLPRLAWLAWAGNPLDQAWGDKQTTPIHWNRLQPGALLGQGASGLVHEALWTPEDGSAAKPVALKLYKGQMTSDGLPEREIAACLAAGQHPHLMGALGRLDGHPNQLLGLVMPLLPPHWRALAAPPSLESCSRDIYDPVLRLHPDIIGRIAYDIAAAGAHLHSHRLLHGDLYAHNILWDGTTGAAMLSDFGAASFLPASQEATALQRLDVLAWGLLLGELLDCCDTDLVPLRDIQRQCVNPISTARPQLAEVMEMVRVVL